MELEECAGTAEKATNDGLTGLIPNEGYTIADGEDVHRTDTNIGPKNGHKIRSDVSICTIVD